MNNLEALFRERIVSGFKRHSVTKCSKWAQNYRVMGQPFPGPWTFKHHPWLREMHDSTANLNIGQKAAQMGFTEWALNVCFYTLDIKGRDVLYVLPAKTPDAGDFSAARFDPALELSAHLSKLFSDVKNVGHKRAGTRNMYIRGSRSRGGLKSVPVYLIIMDEVNEMDQDNIPLAMERTSGQTDYMHILLSTPTLDNVGINLYFKDSTQNHFFFKCPHHSIEGRDGFSELIFPDDLIITADSVNDPQINDSYIRCNHCNHSLDHDSKINWLADGIWIPSFKNNISQGWYINQFYSMAEAGRPSNLAKLAITAQSNKADEQEFYNSKGGLTHAVEGSQVTDTQINQAIGTYVKLTTPPPGLITMGVDQGRWIHYSIFHWTLGYASDISADAHARLISFGKILDFEQLDDLMRQFRISFCVIDAQPERRKATEFAHRFMGHVRLCFYPEGINTKQIHISDAGNEPSVSVDRTTWLDTSLGRFRKSPSAITLPMDIDFEFRQHIKALTRTYLRDKQGNPIGRYVRGNNDDHYAHCNNYAEVAMHLGYSLSRSQDVSGVF